MVIGIIGAGASGMAAALEAAEGKTNQVILFERQGRVGRKLSATGNGRCNLSNIHCSDAHYHGTEPDFCRYALERYSAESTLQWFSDLGLYTVTESSGKVYPYSDQANSVVDILRFSLERANIQLLTGFDVQKIKKEASGFLVESDLQQIHCDKIIIACGGLAGSKLGGTMWGYKLLSKFGHRSSKLRPNLVQIKSSWKALSGLKGVRANVHAAIFQNGILYAESTGEIQFTEMGLSGPVIFEISRDVCSGPGNWTCSLDFLPDIPRNILNDMLRERVDKGFPIEDFLTGIVHNRLGRVLTKAAGISAGSYAGELSDYQILSLCDTLKNLEITLTEPLGMDSAQVTAGGVLTDGFCDSTMESKLVPGLYACGEVLDIDGDCGGYNLQWAWSSGRLAGCCAGKDKI